MQKMRITLASLHTEVWRIIVRNIIPHTLVWGLLLLLMSVSAWAVTDEAVQTASVEAISTLISEEVKSTEKAVNIGNEYTIEEGDVLDIFVWHEENLKRDAIVRPDGKISFPLVGAVRAAGLTFAELQESITEKLKTYINNPVVSVSLISLGGRKVVVLGEVGRPGVYNLSRKSNMLEAIATAGGFTRDAVKSSVILVRGEAKNPSGIRLNLDRTINSSDMSQNIMVQAEDIVYVPETFISNASRFISKITGPVADALYIRNNIRDLGQ